MRTAILLVGVITLVLSGSNSSSRNHRPCSFHEAMPGKIDEFMAIVYKSRDDKGYDFFALDIPEKIKDWKGGDFVTLATNKYSLGE